MVIKNEDLAYLLPVVLGRHVPAEVPRVVDRLQLPEDVHVRRTIHVCFRHFLTQFHTRSLSTCPINALHIFCSPMQLRSLTDFAALIVLRCCCFFLCPSTLHSLSLSRDHKKNTGRKHFFPPQFRTPPPEIMSFPFSRAPFSRLAPRPSTMPRSLAISVPLAPFIRQTTTRKKGFALLSSFFRRICLLSPVSRPSSSHFQRASSSSPGWMGFATAFDFEPCCRNRRRSC